MAHGRMLISLVHERFIAEPQVCQNYLLLLAKELPCERVHKMDLLAHDTGHWLIRIGIVRNRFGGQSLNTDPSVWATVDKSGHRANDTHQMDDALT